MLKVFLTLRICVYVNMCTAVFLCVCAVGVIVLCIMQKPAEKIRYPVPSLSVMALLRQDHSLNLERVWQWDSPRDPHLHPDSTEVRGRYTAFHIHSCWRFDLRPSCLHGKHSFTVDHLPSTTTTPPILFHFHSRKSKIAHNLELLALVPPFSNGRNLPTKQL